MERLGQIRAGLVEVLLQVGPEPALPRLEAADHRVAGFLGVRGGVLRRRGVAAADVPALGAAAQVQPPAARRLALGAAGAARRDGRVDACDLYCHEFSKFSGFSRFSWSGSRTWKRVSPGTDWTRRSPWCLLAMIR